MNLSRTNEAVIKHQQLLSQIMRPTTVSLLQKIKVKEGSNALLLNCGEGDLAFHLAELVGENGMVVGIDRNGENVHTAQQLAIIKNIGNVNFYHKEQFERRRKNHFELVYTPLLLTQFFDPVEYVGQVQDCLRLGAIALFEVIDFAAFNSIPKNFAFERFLDLYSSVFRTQWGDISFSSKLCQTLAQSGFQKIQRQYVSPTFLKGQFKCLPSLTLECIRGEILSQKLTSQDEFQVLLYELKKFEQKTHSLITLPGIHQIWGHKA